jgi:hypothetical protein
MLSFTAAGISAHAKDTVQLQVPIKEGLGKFVDLLAYPPYMALAMENSGLESPRAGHPQIGDARTVRFKILSVRFIERQDTRFVYEAQLRWRIVGTERLFKIPVSVETSAIQTGKVLVDVHLPYTNLLPSAILELIQSTVRTFSIEAIQEKLLAYLTVLDSKKSPGSRTEGLIELILQEGYNRVATFAPIGDIVHEPGDAEPISDQILFLATVAIWFILVPVVAFSFYIRRIFKRHALLRQAGKSNGCEGTSGAA